MANAVVSDIQWIRPDGKPTQYFLELIQGLSSSQMKFLSSYGAKGRGADEAPTLTKALNDWRAVTYNTDPSLNTGGGYPLYINPGIYLSSTTQSFVTNNPESKIIGMGRPTLKHTGTGLAFDAVQTVGNGYGPDVKYLRLQGNANSASANGVGLLHLKNMNHLDWELDLVDCGSTQTAALIEFSLESKFRLNIGKNFSSSSTRPDVGLIVGLAAGGSASSPVVCEFDLKIEGVKSAGLVLENSFNNLFKGTSEGIGNVFGTNTVTPGLGQGVRLLSSSSNNIFDRFFCELNGNADFLDEGHHNIYSACSGVSPLAVSGVNSMIFTGHSNIVLSGQYDTINSTAGAGGHRFINVEVLTAFSPNANDKYHGVTVAGAPIANVW